MLASSGPLRRAHRRRPSVQTLQDVGCRPTAQQVEHAAIADPLLDPCHQTLVRDRVEHSVTILRERHPFEGRSLQFMGIVKRRGSLLLLLVLPDGSRSLVPADWTDWKVTQAIGEPSTSGSGPGEP